MLLPGAREVEGGYLVLSYLLLREAWLGCWIGGAGHRCGRPAGQEGDVLRAWGTGTFTTIYATLSFNTNHFYSRSWDDSVGGRGGSQDELENVGQIAKNHHGRGTLLMNYKNPQWFQDVMLRLQVACHPVRLRMRGEFRGSGLYNPAKPCVSYNPI